MKAKIVDTGVKYSGAKKDQNKVISGTETTMKFPTKRSVWPEPDWISEALSDTDHAYMFMRIYQAISNSVNKRFYDRGEDHKILVLFLKECFENKEKFPLKGKFIDRLYKLIEYIQNSFALKDLNDTLYFCQVTAGKTGKVEMISCMNNEEFDRLKKMGFGETTRLTLNNVYHVGSASYKKSKKKFFTIYKNSNFILNEDGSPVYEYETEEKATQVMYELIETDFLISESLKNIIETIKRRSPLEGELRVGEKHRENDLTVDDFMEKLQFKGIEFGNWVDQRERQQFLNSVYDGYADLMSIIGLPVEMASLKNKLGIAFGSRGTSKASAHFDSARSLIHITKTKAIGSLAHEYAHALDYFLAEKTGMSCCVSEVNENHVKNINNEKSASLFMAVLRWKKAVKNSAMYKNTVLIDADKNKKYYSTDIELFARCFEQWIKLEMTKKGMNNNFLVYDVTPVESENKLFVYPSEKEREDLGVLMGEIVSEIKNMLVE